MKRSWIYPVASATAIMKMKTELRFSVMLWKKAKGMGLPGRCSWQSALKTKGRRGFVGGRRHRPFARDIFLSEGDADDEDDGLIITTLCWESSPETWQHWSFVQMLMKHWRVPETWPPCGRANNYFSFSLAKAAVLWRCYTVTKPHRERSESMDGHPTSTLEAVPSPTNRHLSFLFTTKGIFNC